MPSRESEKVMMTTPDNWPQWPFLPLVNRTRDKLARKGVVYPTTGTLVELGLGDGKFIFIEGSNVFDPESIMSRIRLKKYVEANIDELLDAGWEVD